LDRLTSWLPAGAQQILSPERFLYWGTVVLKIIVILAVVQVAKRVSYMLIERLTQARLGESLWREERRGQTIFTLLNSVARYAIDFIALLMILDLFGVDVKSILAAAGIAGLAIGFGAQNLVRDVISGFFILFEDQFAVGDYITIAGVSGTVEEMGLRVTRVRDFSGELHTVPNGGIDKVTNHTRGSMRVLVSVDIAYEEDVDHAIHVLEKACERASAEMEDLTEGPKVLGVQELGASGVSLLIWAKSRPMQQWAAGRELRRRVKKALDEAGVEIPYPRCVLVPAAATKVGEGLRSGRTGEGRPERPPDATEGGDPS